ncbi:MAG: caspase family protein, partial [Hyphomonas sp.]
MERPAVLPEVGIPDAIVAPQEPVLPPVQQEVPDPSGDSPAGGGDGWGTIGVGDPNTIGHGAGGGDTKPAKPDPAVDVDRGSGMIDDESWEDFSSLEDLEPAAGGSGYGKRCEASLESASEIIVYCLESYPGGGQGDISKSSVPVEGSVDDTLNRLAITLAGGEDRINAGNPEAWLCTWDYEVQEPYLDFWQVSPCPDWDKPLKDQVAAGAGTFETGRVVHHAPSEMVMNQAYVLELGIQPVTDAVNEDEADRRLRDTIGSGVAPGGSETPLALQFETVEASSVMTAELIADGFSVTPITDEEQAIRADKPTFWKWVVRPEEAGSHFLAFNLAQRLKQDGETYDRTVSSTPLFVTVRTIDELLADDDAEPAGPATAGGAGASLMAGRDIAPNTLMATPPNGGAAGADIATVAAAQGCTWSNGSDPDRFALVLSNLAYSPPISRLAVTHGDGDRVATALNGTGFSVLRCRDLGRGETIKAMREVGRKSLDRKQAGDEPVTFFYYSGHGVNVNDANYVLPVDLAGANPEEIEDGAVSFEKIFNLMSTTVASTSFIVFDACRTVMDDDSRGIVRAYSPVT